MSDPSTFTKSLFVPGKEGSPSPADPKNPVPFQLSELGSQIENRKKEFVYDSEKARNFDQGNVQKARAGVKELMRDAIHKATTKAREIREQARKEGYDTGYTEGFKKGEEEARQEFDPLLKNLETLIRDLSEFRKNMFPKLEREMMEMITELAKNIVHHELSVREDSILDIIRLAVESVLHRESMVIKVNPKDKEHAENFRPELQHLFTEIKNITIEGHSGIQRGGCLIETNFGTVDARIENLDDQIEKILSLTPPVQEEPPSSSSE